MSNYIYHIKMSQEQKPQQPNWPSKHEGKPSGGGRDNNPPKDGNKQPSKPQNGGNNTNK